MKMIKKLAIVASLIFGFAACATTNYYTKDRAPTLHYLGTGKSGTTSFRNLYFVVSNPTSRRQHYKLVCKNSMDQKVKEKVVVYPRSDKKTSVVVSSGKWSCTLLQDLTPGTQPVLHIIYISTAME